MAVHPAPGKDRSQVGAYQAAPDPRVIGHGLQHILAALTTQRSGVSATKIVVSLDAG